MMKRYGWLKSWAVVWALWGLLLPAPAAQAVEQPRSWSDLAKHESDAAPVSDVALDRQGHLSGVVVNLHGIPAAGVEVVVSQKGDEILRAKTDALGRFSTGKLPGGVYLIASGGQGRLVRAWTTQAAPPAAKPLALLVVGDRLVRGQMPLEDFFASDAFVITAMVAAAIAIPIAVHNSRSRRPASP